MNVRVKDCLKLYNFRRVERNESLEKPRHYKLLNIQRLGMLLYGGGDEAKYKSIAVSMNRMMSGKATSIRVEFIEKMCEELGVDPNFVFGVPSKHDREFNNL